MGQDRYVRRQQEEARRAADNAQTEIDIVNKPIPQTAEELNAELEANRLWKADIDRRLSDYDTEYNAKIHYNITADQQARSEITGPLSQTSARIQRRIDTLESYKSAQTAAERQEAQAKLEQRKAALQKWVEDPYHGGLETNRGVIGGGILGEGDGRNTVVSTSKYEDEVRARSAGYVPGTTLDKRTLDVFRPVDDGIFSGNTPKAPKTSPETIRDLAGGNKPQRDRPKALQDQPGKLFGDPNFVFKDQPLAQKPVEQPARRERPKTQQGITDKLFGSPTFVTKERQREIDKARKNNVFSASALRDFAPSAKGQIPTTTTTIFLNEQGGQLTKEQIRNERKRIGKQNIESLEKIKGWIDERQKEGRTSLLIAYSGKTKVVDPRFAYKEFLLARKEDPNAIIKAPIQVSLTESLDISDKPIGPIGFKQDEKGKVSVLVAEQKEVEPRFRPNQFIPLSIGDKGEVTGIATRQGKQDLLSVITGQQAPEPSQTKSEFVSSLDKLTDFIEKKSMSDNLAERAAFSFTKSAFAIIPSTFSLLGQAGEAIKPKPRGNAIGQVASARPKVSDTVLGLSISTLGSASFTGPEAQRQAAYLKAIGPIGFISELAGESIGFIGKGPLKLSKYVQEVEATATAPKGAKFFVTATRVEGAPVVRSFDSFVQATKYQSYLEATKPAGFESAKLTAVITPVKALAIGETPIITVVSGQVGIGRRLLKQEKLAPIFSSISPTGRGLELSTLEPFPRSVLTSDEGLAALQEAGIILPRDVEAIKIGQETQKLLGSVNIPPEIKQELVGLTSLKTDAEINTFWNQVLPTLQQGKGNFAQIMQVRKSILEGTGREVTGDFDADYNRIARGLKYIGLSSIADKLGAKRALKDVERAKKSFDEIVGEGRGFEVKGTKLYAGELVEGELTKKEKVLELLTHKEETKGATSKISDLSQVYGKKYTHKSVKGETPEGDKYKLRTIEDQLGTKIASTDSIQGPKTEKFAGEGTPDFLKPGAKIQTTEKGFGVLAPEARLKDVVDRPILMKELGLRLEEHGKKAKGERLAELAEKYKTLFPEIEFTKSVKETSPIPEREIPSKFESMFTEKSVSSAASSYAPPLAKLIMTKESSVKETTRKSAIMGSATRSAITKSAITKSAVSVITGSSIRGSAVRPSPTKSMLGESVTKSPIASSEVSSRASAIQSALGGSKLISKTSPLSPSGASPFSSSVSSTGSSIVSALSSSAVSVIKFPIVKLEIIPELTPKPVRGALPFFERTKKEKRREKEEKERADFLGNALVSQITGLTKRGDITYGLSRTEKESRKDFAFSAKGRKKFLSGKRPTLLSKKAPVLAEKKTKFEKAFKL